MWFALVGEHGFLCLSSRGCVWEEWVRWLGCVDMAWHCSASFSWFRLDMAWGSKGRFEGCLH